MTGTLLAFELPAQVLLSGAMRGFGIGVFAVGIILIYRSCKVINFALGELGALCAAVFVRLVVNWHWNFYAALVFTMAGGALLGALLELAIVRRLFRAPRVILLVATIGAAQLLLFLQFLLPDISTFSSFPTAFEKQWTVDDVIVRADHAVALVVFPLLVVGLAWFLNRSRSGVAIRASADNPDAARLAGISVKRMSTLVWALAGGLAAVATILSAPLAGASVGSTGELGPGILLRTLAAAVIAAMVSLPRAVVAAIVLGAFESVLFYNNPTDPGLINAVLLGVILVAVLVVSLRSRELGMRERFSFAPRIRPVPPRLQQLWWVRHHTRILSVICLAAAVALPLVVTSPSRQYLYARVVIMALVALSLTVLTGWAGQLSLGQFALVGLGGMSTYTLVQHRISLPAALLLAVLISAVAAVVVGAPALRMRGLFLAITTLALAVAAPWILSRDIFLDPDHPSPLLRRPVIGGVSLASQRTYYFVCLALLVLSIVVVARVRRSGLGRSMLAVRDNELAASSMGLSPTRVKLFAFALSGGLAGLAGGALVGLLVQFTPDRFTAVESLSVVAVSVVGGLASIAGTVLGSLFIIGLPAFFPDSPEVTLLTSGVGVLVLLLYFPGGLVQVLYNLRDLAFAAMEKRLGPEIGAADAPTSVPATEVAAVSAVEGPGAAAVETPVAARVGDPGAAAVETPVATPPEARAGVAATAPTEKAPGRSGRRSTPALPTRPPIDADLADALVVDKVSVSFGLAKVVRGVELTVGRGEVVGLIGANGAGKSTLMNAVGGFVPSSGSITLLGHDVGRLPAHRRARLGLGRTFQDAALFGDLTVRETVAVAVETRARAGFLTVAVGLPKASRVERSKQAHADEILDFVGLGPYAQRFVSELSTGMRRIVELACLVASDARMLCLDEPTAGIAQREAEAFGPLLLDIRTELDASMLVIEHDMPLVMAMSDRIYCLEAGAVIASGLPDEVRNNPLVIASYLGTDDRAIDRSDAGGDRRPLIAQD
jgi:ABC-type branched-subunit amino acid transport system ATPase component/ABC-type branched-subunit amino acid transport system permease subunit